MRIVTTLLILAFLLVSQSTFAKDTITWWQFWTDPAVKPVITSMVEEFEKANPDISVELTDLTWANGHEKIAISFASGAGPDVVELGSDWIAQFAANGQLADISEAVADDTANFDGWSMATYKDKIYGRPWILGTRVLYMNHGLAMKAGKLSENFIPLCWDQLSWAAQRIDSLGKDIYGWGSNTAEKHRLYKKYLPFFWTAGAQIWTDDGKYCIVASEPAVDALKFYKKLNDSCGAYVANQRAIDDAFLDGKVGFVISGDWLLKRIKQEGRKLDFRTTLIPGEQISDFSVTGVSFMGGEILTINAASKHKEAARKFIDFITNPDNQLKFCKANGSANPSSRTAQMDDYFQSDPNLQTFITQMRHAKHPPVDPDWVYIENEIEQAVEQAVFENVGPGEALLKARDNIVNLKKE